MHENLNKKLILLRIARAYADLLCAWEDDPKAQISISRIDDHEIRIFLGFRRKLTMSRCSGWSCSITAPGRRSIATLAANSLAVRRCLRNSAPKRSSRRRGGARRAANAIAVHPPMIAADSRRQVDCSSIWRNSDQASAATSERLVTSGAAQTQIARHHHYAAYRRRRTPTTGHCLGTRSGVR